MRLSIIIPAHNEEATIGQVLEKVFNVDLGQWEKEVIVVNDGSSDKTKEAIERWASSQREDAHLQAQVIHHSTNLGKGVAIQTGLQKATGDYVVIQDADLEYKPEDMPKLLSIIEFKNSSQPPLLKRGRDNSTPSLFKEGVGGVAVFGARGHKAYPERGFHYVIGAWMLTAFYNLLFHQRLTDLYTCYKLIPTSIFKFLNIQSTGFEFEAEVACKLAYANVKIKEVPIQYYPRNKNQGKHIRFIDALKGFWMILKLKFYEK